jgi:hypothetical protein
LDHAISKFSSTIPPLLKEPIIFPQRRETVNHTSRERTRVDVGDAAIVSYVVIEATDVGEEVLFWKKSSVSMMKMIDGV